MVALGDAFFFAVDNSHLWVVISPPDGPRNEFVMVNMTSLTDNCPDESCILDVADYPKFIKHQTSIYYIDAKRWWVDGENGYDELLQDGKITQMPAVSPRTLLRIQQGALKSDFFPPDYIPHVQDNLVTVPAVPVRAVPVRPAAPATLPKRFPPPPRHGGS